MPLMPGAEPFSHDGGPHRRAALSTASPAPRRACGPGAEHLADAGLTVAAARGCPATAPPSRRRTSPAGRTGTPRSSGTWPGSASAATTSSSWGCRWAARSSIRLAEEHGDEIAGLVLVNPSLLTKRPDRFLLPVLRLARADLAPASPATSRSPAGRARLRPHPGQGRLPAQPAVAHDPRRPGQGHPADPGASARRGPRGRAGQRPAAAARRSRRPTSARSCSRTATTSRPSTTTRR